MSNDDVVLLVQKSLDGLYEASMIETKILVNLDTPLFGAGSNIDSMSFVALITDVESRLCSLTDKDLFIVLSDIEDLYPNSPILTTGMLANYLSSLVNA